MGWLAKREIIDQHIKELEGVLAEINTALNSSLETLTARRNPPFVSSLEDDVLIRIFRTAGECGFDDDTTLAMSHTCSRWRKLMAKTPTLWRNMDWTSLSLPTIQHYISLNRSVPLDVKVGLEDARRVQECGNLLLRVRNLALRQGTAANIRATPWLFTHPAVELQSLSLRCGSSSGPKNWRQMLDWDDSYLLPHQLFLSRHPKLQEMELIGCRLPWQAGMYKDLTRLTICLSSMASTPQGEGSGRFGDAKFDALHVFRDSPNLTELTLQSCESLPLRPIAPADTLIPMRHLRRLELALPAQDITAILSSIATPLHLRLSLVCVIVKGTPSTYRYLRFPTDPRCLPFARRVRRLEFDAPANRIMAFALDDEDPIYTASVVSDQEFAPEKAIAASFSALKGPLFPILQDLSLKESTMGVFKSEMVAMFLWDHPSIVNLNLTACSPAILAKVAEHHKQENQVIPYCPNLQTTGIDGMRINSSELFDTCSLLARADRILSLSRMHLDKDAGEAFSNSLNSKISSEDSKLMQQAQDTLQRIRGLKFAKVSINDASWGLLRRPLEC